MNTDTRARLKIGAVSVLSLILFGLMVGAIAKIDLRPKREVIINFTFINSLELKAPVRFAGLRVGEVARLKALTPEERAQYPHNPPYVQVFAHIDRNIRIPKNTRAMVSTMGFMGEKYLELLPESRSVDYLEEGVALEGVDPTPMDTVFASAKQLADEMQIAAKNMNAIVIQTQDRLPILIGEMEKTLNTASSLAIDAKRLTGDVQQMFTRNRDDIENMFGNARQISIYTKSFTHVLATRPWKLVWGMGGPLPIEPEEEKYQPAKKDTPAKKS